MPIVKTPYFRPDYDDTQGLHTYLGAGRAAGRRGAPRAAEPAANPKQRVPRGSLEGLRLSAAAELYDPEMRFLHPGRGDSGPGIWITQLADAVVKRQETVDRITVPTAVYQSRGQRRREVPAMWELGGGHPDRDANRICQVIGSPEGLVVPQRDVCRVNHKIEKPNGRHAQVAITEGTLFALGHALRDDARILVYRVDSICEMPPHKSVTPREGDLYAAVNATLVATWIKNWRGPVEWTHPRFDEICGPDATATWLLAKTQAKLEAPHYRPVNIETLRPCRPKTSDEAALHAITAGDNLIVEEVPPDIFVDVMYDVVLDYRTALMQDDDNPLRFKTLPATVDVRIVACDFPANTGEVELAFKFPRGGLRDVFPDDVVLQTRLTGCLDDELPAIFVQEPTLVYHAVTLGELISFTGKLPGQRDSRCFTTQR